MCPTNCYAGRSPSWRRSAPDTWRLPDRAVTRTASRPPDTVVVEPHAGPVVLPGRFALAVDHPLAGRMDLPGDPFEVAGIADEQRRNLLHTPIVAERRHRFFRQTGGAPWVLIP